MGKVILKELSEQLQILQISPNLQKIFYNILRINRYSDSVFSIFGCKEPLEKTKAKLIKLY